MTGGRVDEDAQYEAGLRPRSLNEYIGQDRVRDNLEVSIAAARGRVRSARSRAPVRPARARQDDAGLRDRQRDGRAGSRHCRPGHREARRPCRDAHQPAAARSPVHRRDSPPGARDRGNPLSGDGGLRARHRHRPGSERAFGQGTAAEIHADRRDHARRPADGAAARALRHRPSARLLRSRPTSRRSSAAPPRFSPSRSRTMRRRRWRDGPAARRGSPIVSCGACATTRRCGPTVGSPSTSRAPR